MPRKPSAAVALLVSGALTATPLYAKAADLRDLVGARAAGGESQLQARGYAYHATQKDDYSSHTFWWHADRKECVQVNTEDGRYASIDDVPDSDCGHKDNTAVAVAAVAGVALVAALIASRKKDSHYGGYSRQQRSEYDRGFRDGYSRNRADSYARSDAYDAGYAEGVRARRGNGSGSDYQPSYGSPARINDVRGARAAGAMNTLARRGFRQVDNFVSGNTRYSIQWRGSSRQCVQLTIANGRVLDARDIRSHAKCRGR